MRLEWNDDSFAFTDLEPITAELLRRLPGCAACDDDAASARLFPVLTGGTEPDADMEWAETMQPELQELFASHVDAVAQDLKHMREDEDGALMLTVPVERASQWIHTLNQARLALGARHKVTEDHMNGEIMPEDPADAFAVFQIDFYGRVLGFLLWYTEL